MSADVATDIAIATGGIATGLDSITDLYGMISGETAEIQEDKSKAAIAESRAAGKASEAAAEQAKAEAALYASYAYIGLGLLGAATLGIIYMMSRK